MFKALAFIATLILTGLSLSVGTQNTYAGVFIGPYSFSDNDPTVSNSFPEGIVRACGQTQLNTQTSLRFSRGDSPRYDRRYRFLGNAQR